jgi:RNA polymerase sigma factor (sigma-70 family)
MEKEGKDRTGPGKQPEASVYEQAQNGCGDSLAMLMSRHEPLVRYAVARQNLGELPFAEAVQAGRIGLWKAIRGYDAHRGYQFSTYAYPAIVHHVWQAVKVHCVAEQRAHAIGEWQMFFRHWETGPAQQQAAQEVRESLQALVERLPARLRQVIAVRYEVGGRVWQTYQELGKQLGVSYEWVRQLEIQALIWLRHPAHSQELRSLLQRHSLQDYIWAEEVAQSWLRHRGGRHAQT